MFSRIFLSQKSCPKRSLDFQLKKLILTPALLINVVGVDANVDVTLTTSSTSEDEFTTTDPSTIQTQYHKHKIFSHQVYQNVGRVIFQRSVKKHVESLHCLIYLGFARVCRHFSRAHQCKPDLCAPFISGDGGTPSWGVGAVDGGSVNAFLAAALTRVMRATVPIPALVSSSVVQSVAVGGSVVGVVGPL